MLGPRMGLIASYKFNFNTELNDHQKKTFYI